MIKVHTGLAGRGSNVHGDVFLGMTPILVKIFMTAVKYTIRYWAKLMRLGHESTRADIVCPDFLPISIQWTAQHQ